ncbi:hypothetical protein ACQEVM_36875 [Streptomyces sp. CA-243310]|uniref:hypothetical protein n=1 Tax=Streptomyces sp. CA-243310 TaxID=3240056 RepID=UPI003D94AC7F
MQDPLLPVPPALDQLLVIRRWLELTLARVDERITAVRTVDEQRAHRLPPPEPPRWWIEYGIGADRRSDRVHTGACNVTSRGRSATRDMILEVLLHRPVDLADRRREGNGLLEVLAALLAAFDLSVVDLVVYANRRASRLSPSSCAGSGSPRVASRPSRLLGVGDGCP